MRIGAMEVVLTDAGEPIALSRNVASPVRPEITLLRFVDLAAESLIVAALLGELVLVLANVVARVYFHHSFLWTDEIARLALSILAFIGGAVAYRRRDHAFVRVHPVQAAYRMSQAILGLKSAVEKAMAKNGGKKPSTDELVAAMTGLEWQSPGGLIQMKLADGHQAIQPIAFSRTKYNPDAKRVDLVDIQYFAAECVNPPPGIKSLDWIKGGMQGAKCN